LIDDGGSVVERYEYDAYGKTTILSSAYSVLSSAQYGNPYFFTGRRLDELDSGSHEIMYYRHRTYDAQTGRFMQQDPLAALDDGYIDGMSLYQYVESRPTVYTDSYGLSVDLSILDCYDGCDRFATVERAGCRLRCRRGWDADFPALDAETLKRKLDSLTKKYVPRKPNVKLTIAEIPLGQIPTPFGTIEPLLEATTCSKRCEYKDGRKGILAEVKITAGAEICIGPGYKLKSVRPWIKKASSFFDNGCSPCEDETSGEVSVSFTGKAGAVVTGSLSKGVQLYPDPGKIGKTKLEVEVGAYVGAQICGKLEGSITKSFVVP